MEGDTSSFFFRMICVYARALACVCHQTHRRRRHRDHCLTRRIAARDRHAERQLNRKDNAHKNRNQGLHKNSETQTLLPATSVRSEMYFYVHTRSQASTASKRTTRTSTHKHAAFLFIPSRVPASFHDLSLLLLPS